MVVELALALAVLGAIVVVGVVAIIAVGLADWPGRDGRPARCALGLHAWAYGEITVLGSGRKVAYRRKCLRCARREAMAEASEG